MRHLVSAAVLVLALTGCDAAEKVTGPDPQETADTLADALRAGDFTDLEFTEGTPDEVSTEYGEVVEGMGGIAPVVSAGDVDEGDEGDGTATVPLSWTWPVAGDEWTYTTDATLTEADGAWQVGWSREVIEPSLGKRTVLDVTPIAAGRGAIVGAGGTELVADRPVLRFGIDKTLVPKAKAGDSARRLAQLVDVDATSYVKEVEAAGDQAFVEAIVFRKEDVPLRAEQRYREIDGARAIPDEVPLAPTREFAAPILGAVGQVTAEMVKKDPEKYQAGDVAGLSGLQARYDDQLRGTEGAVVNAEGAGGAERELYRVDPQPGRPLRITLDQRLQTIAETQLADVGPGSALVAIRPSTGNIVAAANGPGNDGYNLATYGQLAPGSTFKSVSSLALLRSGLTPSSVVSCTPSIVVDGKRFENYDDYPSSALGRVPLRTAIANSCNTAVISEVGRLKDGDLAGAAASLGLGIDHDLGFPAYFGSVEPPASETVAAADMIGQGTVLASPMVMATVIASVQAGHTVVPRLVDSVDVSVPEQADPLTKQEAGQLRDMLRAVVTSGSGAGLLDVPGPPVIAKTGTAEFEKDGKVLTHAWMIAAQGDLAVAVFVDVGSSGSGTAGPVLEAFLRAARG
ncbi:MAG TPA: penicillin-binding transpeptidase domain-containing protein [Nocardioides sp.]|nr:penicillin-binding transpeptidase domain-containing protein [Nocardioides sp.]